MLKDTEQPAAGLIVALHKATGLSLDVIMGLKKTQSGEHRLTPSEAMKIAENAASMALHKAKLDSEPPPPSGKKQKK